jgi:hypothetical protein
MIDSVLMYERKFHGRRTAYSSDSVFVAILFNQGDSYDHEAIGARIFPNGFGCIEPPGPSFGFGSIVLTEDEEDGRVSVADLRARHDEDGNLIELDSVKKSLDEYFDGFFVVDTAGSQIKQIDLEHFSVLFESSTQYSHIQFCEFEPIEDDS